MNSRRHRVSGFTLLELLVGLGVLGIFAGALVTIVTGMSRVAARSTGSLLAGRTVLSLQGVLQQELRDADAADVAIPSGTDLELSRAVGSAIPCVASDTAVVIADTAWSGTRRPESARDDIWLLVDPPAGAWRTSAIAAVTVTNCPGDTTAAMRLSLATSGAAGVVVRVMEPVEITAYRSGASDWFGLTPASHASPVQPFAGPLATGTAQWTLHADYLESVLQPRGATATSITIPLAPAP